MMKKFFLLTCFILIGGAFAQVQAQGIDDIDFQVGIKKGGTVLGGHPRSPIDPPSAYLDYHTLYIEGDHPDYMLYLVDTTGDEPNVVYQIFVPSNVDVVVLPATLSGTYELQLYGGGAYYFYSEIEL